jgi:hypothetical protein
MLMMALFVIALRVICHCFAGISFTLIITFVPGSKSLCFPPSPQWSRADLGPLESQQAFATAPASVASMVAERTVAMFGAFFHTSFAFLSLYSLQPFGQLLESD